MEYPQTIQILRKIVVRNHPFPSIKNMMFFLGLPGFFALKDPFLIGRIIPRISGHGRCDHGGLGEVFDGGFGVGNTNWERCMIPTETRKTLQVCIYIYSNMVYHIKIMLLNYIISYDIGSEN